MSNEKIIHRPGFFAHKNKKHSTGRHRTKHEISREAGGRLHQTSKQLFKKQTSKQRKNLLAQQRAEKIRSSLNKKLLESDLPCIVTLLSLDDNTQNSSIRDLLIRCEDNDGTRITKSDWDAITYLAIPRLKSRYGIRILFFSKYFKYIEQKIGFISPDQNNILEVLDNVKISDVVMILWPTQGELSTQSENLLRLLHSQGLPSVINIVTGIQPNGKHRQTLKRKLDSLISRWSGDPDQVYSLNQMSDALKILRTISNLKKRPPVLQTRHPYLIAERIEKCDQNAGSCTLKISGYLRGPPLDVNKLVHINGCGTYQLSKIVRESDPHPLKKLRNEMDSGEQILALANPSKQTSLEFEIVPDPMETEQPDLDIDLKRVASREIKRVPVGTSDYQANWILNDGDDNHGSEQNSDEEECLSEDDEEMPLRYRENEQDDEHCEGDIDIQSQATESKMDDLSIGYCDEQQGISDTEIDIFRKERENAQWPDEVETPQGIPAKQRFQRYRGLKSFRTSPWDPKENLPLDYARIFKISNFKRMKKVVLDGILNSFVQKDIEGSGYVSTNEFVTLHVVNVSDHIADGWDKRTPFIVFGLLPHEHQMSTLNIVLQKNQNYSLPVKNKESLVFQVGFRRFEASPIFSQHTNGQKFKMERFMPNEGAFCATVFAPITFPPASVLIFKRGTQQCLNHVATGMVLDMDPDRIILKRVVLSGHPYKVNKRSAVVRYMFFNAEDVEWFKPVEVYTRSGRHGSIKQSLGLHGLMKCTFDHPMSSQDPVLMNLYKRAFPKWTYNPVIEEDQKIFLEQ